MRYIGLILFTAVLVGGCSPLSGSSESGSASQESTGPNNRFAFRLYKQLKDQSENVFLSPYSISSALAMTYTGARDRTRDEMAEVLEFPGENEQLGKQYRALGNHLNSLADSGLVLNVANSLWAQRDYGFSRDFMRTNREYFSAGLKEVDFKRQHRAIREQINQWVEEKTKDKIQDMLAEGVLDRMTRLVLVNAIYFNGKWEHPFHEKRTSEDIFHTGGGMSGKVPFMNQSLTVPYYESDLYQAVALPYAGKKVSMVIVLPQKASMMEKLEDRLDAGYYQALTDSLKPQEVELSIPRFRLEQKYNLNDPLQEMGMRRAFGGKADFSGMTGKKELYISDVVHQSFVEVDEKGTEAAAATGVVMRKTSVVRKKKFKADHPFIFMIRDDQTHTLLFLGKLGNPEG
jgi:serpin B